MQFYLTEQNRMVHLSKKTLKHIIHNHIEYKQGKSTLHLNGYTVEDTVLWDTYVCPRTYQMEWCVSLTD